MQSRLIVGISTSADPFKLIGPFFGNKSLIMIQTIEFNPEIYDKAIFAELKIFMIINYQSFIAIKIKGSITEQSIFF